MGDLIPENRWVWVVVQDPGNNEQLLGQKDESKDISFIPAFLEKEDAIQGLGLLAREKGHKYEVQAIHYEDLAPKAAADGFFVFILNASGEVLEEIKP